MALADHRMAETDPELGANLMVFFLRELAELTATPNLDRLIPDLPETVARLEDARANQYRGLSLRTRAGRSRQPSSSCAWMPRWRRRPPRPSRSARSCRRSLLWSDTAFLGASRLAGLQAGGPRDPQAADCRP